MNVVDSSGWLEYFADGSNADFFAPAIENLPKLIVPTISIYEVFKRILQQRSEQEALQAIAQMLQARIVNLDTTLALRAAKISIELKLSMADSIIVMTAITLNAILWTQDADLQNIAGVRYIEKRKF